MHNLGPIVQTLAVGIAGVAAGPEILAGLAVGLLVGGAVHYLTRNRFRDDRFERYSGIRSCSSGEEVPLSPVKLYSKKKEKKHKLNKKYNNSSDGGSGGPGDNNDRKINTITKKAFFTQEVIRRTYHHLRNGVYRKIPGVKEIIEKAEYLAWDYLHGDVEVYSKSKRHLGSLDPRTLKIYKPGVLHRNFPY